MARGKKNTHPPVSFNKAKLVEAEKSEKVTDTAEIAPDENRKQYEVVEPVEVVEEGSDEVIEMPADGRIDLLLTDAEAAPALESGAIRLREEDGGERDPFDGISYYEVIIPFTLETCEGDDQTDDIELPAGQIVGMDDDTAAEYIASGHIIPAEKPADLPPVPENCNLHVTVESATKAADPISAILIEVVAPSLNRPAEAKRLEQALAACTIPEGYELKINVQRETEPRPLPVIVNELVAGSEASIVVVLADHIVPRPNLIEAIIAAFQAEPDVGMVGLNIVNMDPLPGVREYCFFALCRPFIDHFPDRQIFCPDYYHFYGDTELGQFASEVGAFHFAEDARVATHHVNTGLANPDDTWRASRSRKKQDVETFERRQAAGLLWGKTFERVNP